MSRIDRGGFVDRSAAAQAKGYRGMRTRDRAHIAARFSDQSSRLEEQSIDMLVRDLRAGQPRRYMDSAGRVGDFKTLEEFARAYPKQARAACERLDRGTSTLSLGDYGDRDG